MIFLATVLSICTIGLIIIFIIKAKLNKRTKTTKVDTDDINSTDLEEAAEYDQRNYNTYSNPYPYYASHKSVINTYDQSSDLRQRGNSSTSVQHPHAAYTHPHPHPHLVTNHTYQTSAPTHTNYPERENNQHNQRQQNILHTPSNTISHIQPSASHITQYTPDIHYSSQVLPSPSRPLNPLPAGDTRGPIGTHGLVKKLTPMSPMIPMQSPVQCKEQYSPMDRKTPTVDTSMSIIRQGKSSEKQDGAVVIPNSPSKRMQQHYIHGSTTIKASPGRSPTGKSTKLHTLYELDTSTYTTSVTQEQKTTIELNSSAPNSQVNKGGSGDINSPGLKNSEPLVNLKFFTYYSNTSSDHTDNSTSSSSRALKRLTNNNDEDFKQQQQQQHINHPHTITNTQDNNFNTISITELSLDRMVGGGGFGQVWLGKWRGTPVAVKILSMQQTTSTIANIDNTETQKLMDSFQDEVVMLSKLRHPNICLFMGASYDPLTNNRAIITEYVSRGSLWDALRVEKTSLFPAGGVNYTPRVHDLYNDSSSSSSSSHMIVTDNNLLYWPNWAIKKVIKGTCMGLIYLHSHKPSPIIHRDLKSPNLLLTESYDIKICDFGLAKLRSMTISAVMTSNVGTAQWMAPEVINGSYYNESADIYSLGLILWELCTGHCPFEGMNSSQIAVAVVVKGYRPALPSQLTHMQTSLIQRCWHSEPSQRPTATDLLNVIDNVFPT